MVWCSLASSCYRSCRTSEQVVPRGASAISRVRQSVRGSEADANKVHVTLPNWGNLHQRDFMCSVASELEPCQWQQHKSVREQIPGMPRCIYLSTTH
eukprot:9097916-Lingulodinium_polyedra.AAC.1